MFLWLFYCLWIREAHLNRNKLSGIPIETTSILITTSSSIAASPEVISVQLLSHPIIPSLFKSKAIQMYRTITMPNIGFILELEGLGKIDPFVLCWKMQIIWENITGKTGINLIWSINKEKNNGNQLVLQLIL